MMLNLLRIPLPLTDFFRDINTMTYTRFIASALFVILNFGLFAQETGVIRGFVYEESTGEPVLFANVVLSGTGIGTTTNTDGFFTLNKVPAGKYEVSVTFIGYVTLTKEIDLKPGALITEKFYLSEGGVQLSEVEVSAERQEMKTEVRTAVTKVTAKEIEILPSFGGQPDLAQYVQVLPGVIFTGDQGGQLYIRGGTPIQNLVMLDGMVVYNPFHSIGFFSVFETDIIKTADIYTGGFGAEFGGRTSSVMNIETRDGNKNRLSGKATAGTFMAGISLEGPLVKENKNGGSLTFLTTFKHSYLDESSSLLYNYVNDDEGLPFGFTDFYGKVSSTSGNGSMVNFFGFNFNDRVNYSEVADLEWSSYGFGSNFILIPAASPVLISGDFAFSDYGITLREGQDAQPRYSNINGFNLGLDFTYFLEGINEVKYGIDILGFSTDFVSYNAYNQQLQQAQNTTELSGFVTFRTGNDRWIVEPGLRLHYYASLSEASFEPRIGLKFNATENLRLKASGGLYSQNLLAANSDRDVVNLFYGFLSGSGNLPSMFDGKEVTSDLQRARHLIVGSEYDLTKNIDIQIEGYIKDFNQITNVNRDKIYADNADNQDQPEYLRKDFIIERGLAYGVDFTLKYASERVYVWTAYSLGKVNRFDGFRTYRTHFDRRHNLNVVAAYTAGENKDLELTFRWNYGTGFPFTQTAGFYENESFGDGINTDITQSNGDLGILYGDLNGGQLPDYHRLDIGVKKTWELGKYSKLEGNFSVTNIYNRNNIFYFDRVEFERVDQLPILPSIALTLHF